DLAVYKRTRPSFFAAAISSGEPKSCAAAGIAITLTTPSAVNVDFMAMFLLLLSCSSSRAANAGLSAASAGQPSGDPDHRRQQDRLHQAEGGRFAGIAALIIVEQKHRHDHGVAGVEKQRGTELAARQDGTQRHRRDRR